MVKKIQILTPDSSYVDVLHPESDDSMILMTDATTLASKSAVYTDAAATGAVNIDARLYNVAVLTLAGAITLNITNAPAGIQSFVLKIIQPAAPKTVTYSNTIKWNNDAIADVSAASKTYTILLHTVNSGTTWVGQLSNQYTT